MNVNFFINSSYAASRLITRRYSTSFSLATSLLEKEKRRAIYAVYGFVRLADEIVDSLHAYDNTLLLKKLNDDLEFALAHGISTNMVLVAFADTVARYKIDKKHIQAFMQSMERDLSTTNYHQSSELEAYIYGSADVVGLICLKIFCDGDAALYAQLEKPAQKLGSAFQKVNFLRDLKEDMQELGRVYFPEISHNQFNAQSKKQIEESIKRDFQEAWEGIKHLPGRSKLAVALAYHYYHGLFKKIKRSTPQKVICQRVRISNIKKYYIIMKTSLMYTAKLI